LRRCNAQVTRGLADILARCLAQDPARRYPDAASLAADLRLHLADRPLRGVRNRSLVERWQKWRRRRPYAMRWAALLLALAGAGTVVWSHFTQQVHQANASLEEGTEHMGRNNPEAASSAFLHGLKAVERLPFEPSVVPRLRAELRRAQQAIADAGFHKFMERLRGVYGEGLPPAAAWFVIDEGCQRFWEKREQIARPHEPQTPAAMEQNRQDLLDLAVIWTDLRVRRAAQDAGPARRQALLVLEQAERLCGPSAVLYHERAAHAAALGLTDVAGAASTRAAALKPNTAWEHYAVGRALLRDGDLAGAAAAFDRALSLEPQALWPNFYQGKCAFQQKRFDDALTCFNACVVLAPTSAWCFATRGLSHAALGKTDSALRDFDKALKLDPKLTVARLNRGILLLRERRYNLALADLEEALKLGADTAEVHHDLALVHLAQGNRSAARASLQQALQADPTYEPARALAERLKREP
jgi:tetratricopeptide (TPR) repeat protein